MECGSQDAFCQLANWFTQNDLLAPWLIEVIGRSGGHASGILGLVAQFVRDNLHTIIGLFGASFGLWRWWRYREHILHKRLEEYLRESDARLAAGTSELIEFVQRPAPGQQLKDPLFADADLRVVLRERNWDNDRLALSVEQSSDRQLADAIRSIEWRLVTARDQMMSLHRQLACAHTLRGAIAASQARRTRSNAAHARALMHFSSALSVPGNHTNITVKELEAHQRRKLGIDTAEESYRELFSLAKEMPESRDKEVFLARAARYCAEVVRLRYPAHALSMMTADNPNGQFYPGALLRIAGCEPLSSWERLEKADMHYFAALCAFKLGYSRIEATQRAAAEAEYRRITSELGKSKWWRPRRLLRLRKRVAEGLARTSRAYTGQYDFDWLPAD